MRIFDREYTQPKMFLPGTRRSRRPADTLKDFGRHMRQIGITRLANVTGLDSVGIPVVQAIRPCSRSLSVSQGKGVDLDSAKVSAMMEAIELWHAERIELPRLCASYHAMRRKGNVINLDQLPHAREARIRAEQQRSWLLGWDILQEQEVWVPFEFVSMNTVSVIQERREFLTTSTGLASGNHILEAIGHALCEVIERDTYALDKLRGQANALKRKVDIDTITEPSLKVMLAACAAADLEIAIFGMESDVALSSFRAGLMERQGRRLGSQWGYGTHLSPVIALSRAITEAAQARLTVIAGNRDDNLPSAYAVWQLSSATEESWNKAFAAPATRPFSTAASYQETETFEGDLEVMLEALRSVGVDRVVIIDLTKEHIGIPVVKVIVPGFETSPFDPGHVGGRRAHYAIKSVS